MQWQKEENEIKTTKVGQFHAERASSLHYWAQSLKQR